MPIITLFSGSYCSESDVVGLVRSKTGFKLITDSDIVAEAGRCSGLSEDKIRRVFSAKSSIFDKFGTEKERSLVYLKRALADMLSGDRLLISGFCAQLLPQKISHALKVCLIADLQYRISVAVKTEEISGKEALKRINKQDEDRVAWILTVYGRKDPWDGSLYDIVLPMDKTDVDRAVTLIVENVGKKVIQPTEDSKRAVADFQLETLVEEALVSEGHSVDVSAEAGAVTLTINRHVLRLGRLKEELHTLTAAVPGVLSVEVKVGKGFHQPNVYRRHDFSLPDRVLIVDDEREFVESLSDRLVMCDIGAAVTYDGESALNLISEEEPEVMILDLKMPGIDGIEVLRRVKQTRPEVEVIILTTQGTEAEKETCMKLGAFAFLEKPVDIHLLSETLRKAKQKVQKSVSKPRKPPEC